MCEYLRVVRDLLRLPIGVFLALWVRHTVSMSQHPMHDPFLANYLLNSSLFFLYLMLMPSLLPPFLPDDGDDADDAAW